MPKLNQYSNVPTDELIRLGQFIDDPFIEELINRLDESEYNFELMEEEKDEYISDLEQKIYNLEQELKSK